VNKEALALQLLMIGFKGKTPTPFVRDLLRRGLGGVILFARNIESAEQVATLNNELSSMATTPHRLLISIDQEGGRVARLREGFTKIPTMRKLGEAGDLGLAYQVGTILGEELRAVGVSYDFAPVLDVDTNPKNPVIGDRAFSRDPNEVARMGLSIARGLLDAGVLPCGKHFPGHGDTHQDSHKTLPILEKSLDDLRRVELVPFQEAVKAGLASMMTAHVVYPALDASLPATLSKVVVNEILRREMGYEGVLVSDDLEMAAVAERFDIGEAARMCVEAGLDIVLVCHDEARQEAALRGLLSCDTGILERAVERVHRMRMKLSVYQPIDVGRVREKLQRIEYQAMMSPLLREPAGVDPTEAS
jgi:beta-N-acetylhexosaminidase